MLTKADLSGLQSSIEESSLHEVENIYLPLSYLIQQKILNNSTAKTPYMIGVTGSVAVGKSTFTRILQTILSRWPNHPNVAMMSTDGFIYSKAELEEKGLLKRKGFPESFRTKA